jgi:hypothetical protein
LTDKLLALEVSARLRLGIDIILHLNGYYAAMTSGIQEGELPLLFLARRRISLFFFRISLFLLDKPARMDINTPLVEKHYVR